MDCFISFSHHDQETAVGLRDYLAAKGVSTFFSPQSIPTGSDWASITRTRAGRAEVLVLLDSPSSRKSAWVQQESGMALASGSLLIPVSLDGELNQLPGWVAGIQGIRRTQGEMDEHLFARIAEQVTNRFGFAWSILPQTLQELETIGAVALRAILLDQFSGPAERAGAWSRQYDRYLRLNYGDQANIPTGVSQGASLTFTGMIVEKLCSYSAVDTGILGQYALSAARRAEAFILSCQDNEEGGFGRRSSEFRARGGRGLTLDIRHTCWAIRALLSIDPKRLQSQIEHGLEWLARRARNRADSDKWCWTTAPLLALIMDVRLQNSDGWRRESLSLSHSVSTDLEDSFDASLGSWTKGEANPALVAIDNALYVLHCLRRDNISGKLRDQCNAAIERLMSRSLFSVIQGQKMRGIPLFDIERPDVGPTCQLLDVLPHSDPSIRTELRYFIEQGLRARLIMPETFAWHLGSILNIPDVCNQPMH